jgi:predicted nucleic acid-binding protein
MRHRPCLLDSSFVIDLLNEVADARPGPAWEWLRRNKKRSCWISPVTMAEVLEGADDTAEVRNHLSQYRWQGIHHRHAEVSAALQRRTTHRMGENDAWQAAITLIMDGSIVGHDPKAFSRLGDRYEDHRRS